MAGTTGLTVLSEIASLVTKFAPLLGNVLGGPFAGVAISLLTSLFGVDPSKTDSLLEKIKNDPSAEVKIKTLELQHEGTLKQLEAQNYAVQVDDRKNARERQISLRSRLSDYMAVSFFLYYVLVQFYYSYYHTPIDSHFNSTLSEILIKIVNYYFGS